MVLDNLRNWMIGGTRGREASETRAAWEDTQRLWRASPLGRQDLHDLTVAFVRDQVMAGLDRVPETPILVGLCEASEEFFRAEDIEPFEPRWETIDGDAAMGVQFRKMVARRRRYAADFPRMHGIIEALPESCFRDWGDEPPSFEVPLIELVEDPALLIEQLMLFPYTDDTLRLDLFEGLRGVYARNLVVATGLPPDADPKVNEHKLIMPSRQKNKSPAELGPVDEVDSQIS
jgi:hypothetical protein